MKITKLFRALYYDAIRQETGDSWDLMILHLKRFRDNASVYECTDDEFKKLVHLCREIEKQNPKALSFAAGVTISYQDPLEKKIGTHGFMWELSLRDEELDAFVAKHYPNG